MNQKHYDECKKWRNDIQHNDTQHKGLCVALRKNHTQHNNVLHYAECRYAECLILFIVILSVIMLKAVFYLWLC